MTSSVSITHWVSRISSNELSDLIQEKRPSGRFFLAVFYWSFAGGLPLTWQGGPWYFLNKVELGKHNARLGYLRWTDG